MYMHLCLNKVFLRRQLLLGSMLCISRVATVPIGYAEHKQISTDNMKKQHDLLMLVGVCLSAIVVAASVAVNESVQDLDCPLWTSPAVNGSCRCGDNLRGTVGCDDSRGATTLKKCFCMTTRSGDNFPQVGTCLYWCSFRYPQVNVIGVNTTAEVTSETCGVFKRTGVMCGECIPGYGLPV